MTDTEARMCGLISKYLDRDAPSIAAARGKAVGDLFPVADLDADSLDMIELTMAIEEEFQVEITDDEGDPHANGDGRPLGELIQLIDKKRAANAKVPA